MVPTLSAISRKRLSILRPNPGSTGPLYKEVRCRNTSQHCVTVSMTLRTLRLSNEQKVYQRAAPTKGAVFSKEASEALQANYIAKRKQLAVHIVVTLKEKYNV